MSKKVSFSPICRNNILFILQAQGQLSKKAIREAYVALEPDCTSDAEFGIQKNGWSKLEGTIHTGTQWLEKKGLIVKAGRGIYDVVATTPTISEFTPWLNANPQAVSTPTPVVEVVETTSETQEVQEIVETQEVQEVSVSNPAVIEAHIDNETNELVENVGGSKDYRTPLNEVQEGYITSNVEVTTTTLNVEDEIVEDSTSNVEVIVSNLEVEEEIIEETQEEVQVAGEVDDAFDFLEDDVDVADEVEEEEESLSYDLKELRKAAKFDPINMNTKWGTKLKYEVYRDDDNRNLVLTQPGRDDYTIVSIDVVDSDLPSDDERYKKFRDQAINQFDSASNHKEGSALILKAVAGCTKMCDHTDDLGGLVETCVNPHCPVHAIWSKGTKYVNPQAS
jgi:hypothetical protein